MLLAFLPRAGEAVVEQHLTRSDLNRAEEMFLCSTLRDMSPVTQLDGAAMPAAPSTERLLPLFSEYLRERIAERDGPHWRRLTD
jgi:branched-subunit amino acid aminotransferase/4-amino-4-deoxychorismate lyase